MRALDPCWIWKTVELKIIDHRNISWLDLALIWGNDETQVQLQEAIHTKIAKKLSRNEWFCKNSISYAANDEISQQHLENIDFVLLELVENQSRKAHRIAFEKLVISLKQIYEFSETVDDWVIYQTHQTGSVVQVLYQLSEVSKKSYGKNFIFGSIRIEWFSY